MIQIAVLGYGTVGSGVVEVINTNHDSINKRAENEINIKYVLDLRDFPGDPVEKVLVHDYEVIANDPEVDIVVEVMGGVERLTPSQNVRWRLERASAHPTKSWWQDTVPSFLQLQKSTAQTICLRQAAAAVSRSSVR